MRGLPVMSRLRVFRSALAAALMAFWTASVQASVADSLSQEVRAIFCKAQNAIVRIEALDAHGKLVGTGFFIDPNGTVYTSYSVGGQSREIIVSHGETKYPATRLLADARSGIALLKVSAQTPFLSPGNSTELSVASPVITAGYGVDLPLAPAFGIVGGFDLKHMDRYFAAAHIRANLPVQRGQGGAPLLNLKGEVIGILISSVEDRAGCYALPIEAAEKVRNDYLRFGEVRPGWIGIDVGIAPPDPAPSNVIVHRLFPGSPAEHSGLQSGDRLLEIGKQKVNSREDILNASFYLTAGETTCIKVQRGDQVLSFSLRAGEHPSMRNATAQTPASEGIPLRVQ